MPKKKTEFTRKQLESRYDYLIADVGGRDYVGISKTGNKAVWYYDSDHDPSGTALVKIAEFVVVK